MKPITFIILMPFFFQFFTGCIEESKTPNIIENIAIDIDKDTFYSEFPNSECFSNTQYIPLETNNNCLIATLDKVLFFNNSYYILDTKEDQVLVFDKKGKFLSKIGRMGKGPGEFISVDDIAIKDNILYLLARDSKKILSFDSGGTFLKEIKINAYCSNMIPGNNNDIYLYKNFSRGDTDSHTNILRVSINTGSVISEFHTIKESQSGQGYSRTTFTAHDNEIYCFFPNDYFIYKIENDSTIPAFRIDFGKENSLPEDSRYMNYDEIKQVTDIKKIGGIDRLIILNDNLIFSYVYTIFGNVAIYNFKTKNIHKGYLNGTLNFPLLQGYFVGGFENKFNFATESRIVVHNLSVETEYKKAVENLSFSSNITREDNPILLITELKNE